MLLDYLRTIVSTLTRFYKHGVPSHILSFGDSLGDNLLLSVLAKALYERGFNNLWVKCNHGQLFLNNPHVKVVMPFNTLLSTFILRVFGVKSVHPRYTEYQKETDQDIVPEKHIILKMADSIPINGRINNKPVFCLDDKEIAGAGFARGQIVIMSSNIGANFSMKNKEWIHERYQQVINDLREMCTFIQIGSVADPVFENVCDMRGKTSIRETAAILKNAALMISHVGFLMHLARALDCRSVIIYGGREKPEQSGYTCFENIYSAVQCSPCWLHNRCDHGKQCMTAITVEMVKNAVFKQLQLAGTPLEIDVLLND